MILLKAEWFPFFQSPQRVGVNNEIVSCDFKRNK
uniref:Uncharacterized protein n=1 Tax=Providencia rettgeri TaxID=587 RepID=A0A220DHN3_PRORE|nr:hypothetical protein PRE36P2_0510 [Providencia rettgeri]